MVFLATITLVALYVTVPLCTVLQSGICWTDGKVHQTALRGLSHALALYTAHTKRMHGAPITDLPTQEKGHHSGAARHH